MLWKRILALLSIPAWIAVLLCANIYILSRPEQLEARLHELYRKNFRGRVDFGDDLSFGLFAGLSAKNVSIRIGEEGPPLLNIDGLSVKPDILRMALGDLYFETVTVDSPEIVFTLKDGKINWEGLLKVLPSHPSRNIYLPYICERVEVKNGRLLFEDDFLLAPGEVRTLDKVNLLATFSDSKTRAYSVSGTLGSDLFGVWRLSGTFHPEGNALSEIEFASDDILAGTEVRKILSDKMKRVWDQTQPCGVFSVRAPCSFDTARIIDTLDWRAYIDFEDLCITSVHFQLPVAGISGRVEVHPGGVIYRDVKGSRNGATFEYYGDIYGFGDDAGFDTNLKIRDIPLDEDFLSALREKPRKILADVYQARGGVHVDASFHKDRGTPKEDVDTRLDVTAESLDFKYAQFPYAITGAKGRITIEKDRIIIKELQSEQKGGKIRILDSESWWTEEGTAVANLQIEAENLPIDEEFISAFDTRTAEIWESFAPGGRADFTADITYDSRRSDPLDYAVLLTPRNSKFTFDIFPYPLENVAVADESGECGILFRPGRVEIKNIVGFHGDCRVVINGVIEYGADGSVKAVLDDLRFENCPWDADFAAAFPAGSQAVLNEMIRSGTFDIAARIEILRGADGRTTTNYTGTVEISEGSFSCGPGFEKVAGTIVIEKGYGASGEPVVFAGNGRFTALELSGVLFKNADMSFHYTNGILDIEPIHIADLGGELDGKVKVRMPPASEETVYEGDFQAVRMDLNAITRNLMDSDAEGTVYLSLNFEGTAGSDEKTSGSGRLEVKEAKIWNIPVIVSLLSAITFRDPTRTYFDRVEVDFDIDRGKIVIRDWKDMVLQAPSIDFEGSGIIDLETKEVDLRFKMKLLPELVRMLPGIGRLMSFFVDGIIGAKTTGTLTDPKTILVPLPELTPTGLQPEDSE